jgi:hypothetical protein
VANFLVSPYHLKNHAGVKDDGVLHHVCWNGIVSNWSDWPCDGGGVDGHSGWCTSRDRLHCYCIDQPTCSRLFSTLFCLFALMQCMVRRASQAECRELLNWKGELEKSENSIGSAPICYPLSQLKFRTSIYILLLWYIILDTICVYCFSSKQVIVWYCANLFVEIWDLLFSLLRLFNLWLGFGSFSKYNMFMGLGVLNAAPVILNQVHTPKNTADNSSGQGTSKDHEHSIIVTRPDGMPAHIRMLVFGFALTYVFPHFLLLLSINYVILLLYKLFSMLHLCTLQELSTWWISQYGHLEGKGNTRPFSQLSRCSCFLQLPILHSEGHNLVIHGKRMWVYSITVCIETITS